MIWLIPILTGALMAWGGKSFLQARRWGIPILLTGTAIYATHQPWMMVMLVAIGLLSMGYGEDAPLRHVFGDCWGRGVWGLLVGMSLSLAAFFTGHLAWYWLAAYLVACFFAEPLFKNLYQVAGDLIIGIVLGTIVVILK